MADPRLDITSRELIFAATAFRAEAHRAEMNAADPKFGTCQRLFAQSAASSRKLARKFDRIARVLDRRPAPR